MRTFVQPSDDFRRQRDDLHEFPLAQLTSHGTEDAGPLGLLLVVDQYCGVLIESDVRAVPPPHFLHGPDEHRLVDVALLDLRARKGVLYRDDDDVAQTAVAL